MMPYGYDGISIGRHMSPVILPMRRAEEVEVYSFWICLISVEVQAPPRRGKTYKDRWCPVVGAF